MFRCFEAEEKKRLVDKQMLIIEKEKRQAEVELVEAMPMLIEAQQGLDTLKSADLSEMRSFANPVDTLRLIGYSMLIYLAHPTITWKDVRTFSLIFIFFSISLFRFERSWPILNSSPI
jgi:hypothetical protein